MKNHIKIADEIARIGRMLYLKNMIAAAEGNISARLSDTEIMVTGSGISKQNITIDDLAVVDLKGNILQGFRKATSELKMHLAVYSARPDIGACVHSHAPNATSFAVAGQSIPANVLPEMALFIGEVPLVEYAPPGTEQVGISLRPYLDDSNAFLLSNHGLLTVGTDLLEAYNRHETVEHCAHIIRLARQLGKVRSIPDEDLERLGRMRQAAQTETRQRGQKA
ncbi:MAG: class II aldolase/adducin family protein [Candidatus Zixiibacteriota bacterium]